MKWLAALGIGSVLLCAEPDTSEMQPMTKVLLTNAAMAAGITAWGLSQWDYGTEDLHSGSEGWFGRDTSNGGADKLGHFYTNYVITRALTPLFESWGYRRYRAAEYAALSASFASVVVMEVGDATSPEHGFSYEDFLMDLLGSAIGYYWAVSPALAESVDFRVEYAPDLGGTVQSDITTDYESMKHLMVFKASGCDVLQAKPWRYLELHFGYYARKFHHNATAIEERERWIYAGIGINLSELLEPILGSWSGFFNYYQMPYTYLPYDVNLDKE